jgi:hypothetical protein
MGYFFLKIEDNGAASLTHHLPADFEGNCNFASAPASGCWLVEADCTSRTEIAAVALTLLPSTYKKANCVR